MSHSIHHVPGRLRVRSNAFRCRPARMRAARNLLDSMDGVTQVRLNDHAGSITVLYEPERLTKEALLEAMKDLGCDREPLNALETLKSKPALASKAGQMFGKALVGAVINKAVERSAFKLVSVLL